MSEGNTGDSDLNGDVSNLFNNTDVLTVVASFLTETETVNNDCTNLVIKDWIQGKDWRQLKTDVIKEFKEIDKDGINKKDVEGIIKLVTETLYHIFNLIYNNLHVFIKPIYKPIYSIIESAVINKKEADKKEPDKKEADKKEADKKEPEHIVDRIMLNPMVKIIVINYMIGKFISGIIGILMIVLFGYACTYIINSKQLQKSGGADKDK